METYGANIDKDALIQCFAGQRARDLFVMNDIATLRAKPQFFPWFTVDDKNIVRGSGAGAFREQFLLGDKICTAYVAKTGKQAPPGCDTFPKNDAQLGADPWQLYKTAELKA